MAKRSKKKSSSVRSKKRTKSSTAKGRTVRGSSSGRKRRKKVSATETLLRGSVGYGKGSDPLDFQISARVKLPKGRTISARVLAEAIRYRIDNGRNPKGIQLKIIRWRNPARITTSTDWRYPEDQAVKDNAEAMGYGPPISPQQAAWRTLSSALVSVQIASIEIRNS